MPYNTKSLIGDKNNQYINQYFNDTTDSYEAIKGANGAVYVIRKVESEVATLIPDTSIRDTNYYYSPAIDGSKWSKRFIKLKNGLDQTVDVSIEISRDGGATWEYGEQLDSAAGAGATRVYGITGNAKTTMSAPLPLWRLRVKASANPTTGTLNAWYIQYN